MSIYDTGIKRMVYGDTLYVFYHVLLQLMELNSEPLSSRQMTTYVDEFLAREKQDEIQAILLILQDKER